MLNYNPIITQIDTKCKLSGQDGRPVLDPTLYRSLAGVLQYLTLIRPDLSYAIQQIYLFMHDPREAHFQLVKRIMRMSKGPLTLAFNFIPALHLNLWHTLMLNGPAALIDVNQHPVFACSWYQLGVLVFQKIANGVVL
jgi:hypothetical protein